MAIHEAATETQLQIILDQHFGLSDLYELCSELETDHESLVGPNETKQALVRALIKYCRRRAYLPHLFEAIELKRPKLREKLIEIQPIDVSNVMHFFESRPPFFGRKDELRKVINALKPNSRGWGIIIDGAGGIGKTALAVEAAYQCAKGDSSRLRDVYKIFIFLSAKRTRLENEEVVVSSRIPLSAMLNQIARVISRPHVIDIPDNKIEIKIQTTLDCLQNKKALLVVDNVETLSEGDRRQVNDFLRRLPTGCKAIITTRVNDISLDNLFEDIKLPKLDPKSINELFDSLCNRHAALASKIHDWPSQSKFLYEFTSGSPLALIFWMNILSKSDLTIAELQRRPQLTDTLLNYVYQSPEHPLNIDDRLVLGVIGMCGGMASRRTIEDVSALGDESLRESLNKLSTLHVIERPSIDGRVHFSLQMGKMANEYARSQLRRDSALFVSAEQRYKTYWSEFARSHGYPNQEEYAKLDREHFSLKKMLELTLEESQFGKQESPVRRACSRYVELVRALSQFFLFFGHWDTRVEVNEKAYFIAEYLQDWQNQGWRAYDVAYVCYNRAETEKAHEWTRRCVDAWSRANGTLERGLAARMEGLVLRQQGRYPESEAKLLESFNVLKVLAADRWNSYPLNDLGGLMRHIAQQSSLPDQDALDRLVKAREYYQQALDLAVKIENKEYEARYRCSLGNVAIDLSDWQGAENYFKDALVLAESLHRVDEIARIKHGLSLVREYQGQISEAKKYAVESQEVYRLLKHRNLPDINKVVTRLS